MGWLQLVLAFVPTLVKNSYVKSALISLFAALGVSTAVPNVDSATAIYTGLAAFLVNLLQKQGPIFLEWLIAFVKAKAGDVDFSAITRGPDDPTPPAAFLLLIGALWFVGSSTAWAAPPKAIVKGPRNAVPGEFLKYDFSGSQNVTGFRLDVSPTVPGYEQVKLDKQAKTADVATFAGTYRLALTVWNEDESDRIEWLLNVDGRPAPVPLPEPVPTPNPGPTPTPVPTPPAPTPQPTPSPDPVFPAGRFGMAEATYRIGMSVSSPTRATDAQCLFDGCQALEKRITAGELLGPQGIVTAIGADLDRCTAAGWDTPRLQLSERIKELYQAGRLSTNADWVTLLQEAQSGLAAVVKASAR